MTIKESWIHPYKFTVQLTFKWLTQVLSQIQITSNIWQSTAYALAEKVSPLCGGVHDLSMPYIIYISIGCGAYSIQ